MQINVSGRDRFLLSHDILRVIAAFPQPERSVPPLLQAAREVTGASVAAFVFFEEPEIRIIDAESSAALPADADLRRLAADLTPGMHLSPALPTAFTAQAWLAAPVLVNNVLVGVFWLAFESPYTINEEHQQLLEVLLDGFTIVAGNTYMQEKHEGAQQLMSSLLNSISDPILVLDEQRRLLLMNAAAETLFEVKSAEMAGKPVSQVIHDASLLELAEGHQQKLDEWSTAEQKRTFVPRIEIARDADGNTEGWVLAMRDVTRFKRLNRNQSEFTRIVSHDLRSPLTSMQGFASMLEMVGDLNDRQKQFVEKILAGISQMASLVDNIQDAGRYDPETGFYEMQRSQVDLIEMVRRIVDNHLLPAEKQELTLEVVSANDVPIISADSNMLERAIINLVDNAIKYTPNGGKIVVHIQRRDNRVVIGVQDDGLGINPEHQKMLFERHVRIPRQEHKRVKGSGLGLFIVRSVAQRHGGEAWVESQPGAGSTFFISVPLEGANLVGSAAIG